MQKVSLLHLPEWEALRHATEDLYEAFSAYPLRTNIPCCADCIWDEDNAKLHSKPLHELTHHELDFVMADPGTWGEEVDFKHLLPRLFELCSLDIAGTPSGIDLVQLGWRVRVEATGFAAWPSRERAFTSFCLAPWPSRERAALTSFCLALWRAALATWPSTPLYYDDTADSILCAIAQFTDDLTPYLAAWRERLGRGVSLTAVAHLLTFTLQREWWQEWWYVPNVYWEDRRPQLQQVRAWVEDPTTASITHHTLRRAHVPGGDVGARRFDAENPEHVAQSLAWIARRAKDA